MDSDFLRSKVDEVVFREHRLFLDRNVEVTFQPDGNGVDHCYMVYKLEDGSRACEYGPFFTSGAAAAKVNELLT
jgi:hypothetical protein